MEKSKRSGTTLKTIWHMEHVRHGMNADNSPLEPMHSVCDHLNKEKQSRDDDTNNKEDWLQKQTSLAVVQSIVFMSHWPMYSWVSTCFMSFCMWLDNTDFQVFQVTSHIVGLVVLCDEIPIHLLSMHPLIHFSPVREFLVEAHTVFHSEKIDVRGVIFTYLTKCDFASWTKNHAERFHHAACYFASPWNRVPAQDWEARFGRSGRRCLSRWRPP